jgi:hypothetical protein
MAAKREGTHQFNFTLSKKLVAEFNAYCLKRGFIRDVKIESALSLLLDVEARTPPVKVVVPLNRQTGEILQRMREEVFLAGVVEGAVIGWPGSKELHAAANSPKRRRKGRRE